MIYTPSPIERLQLDMGAIAQNHPDCFYVPVNIVRPRVNADGTVTTAVMIQDKINNSLAGILGTNGKGGATIVIDMPEGEVPNSESTGPDLRLICKVRVIENPIINMGANGTLKSAEDLMLTMLNLFHGRYWEDSGGTMVADKDAFRPLMDAIYLQKNYVAYDTRFMMRLGIQSPRRKTPKPAISGSVAEGMTILGVGNIYYTTDGSYPTPANGTLAPGSVIGTEDNTAAFATEDGSSLIGVEISTIPIATPTLARAVAYQDNQLASDLAAKYIS